MLNQTKQTHHLLESFVNVAPLLNTLILDDITVGIYDKEKLLLNIPAKTFALDVTEGDPLVEGDIITNAIREGEMKHDFVPKELFGFPLVAKAIPLFDENGQVVGGVGIGTSLENANQLHEVAESLSAVVEQTSATIQDVSSSVTDLADRMKGITTQVSSVQDSAKEIHGISKTVREISDQSNLLGLNASIEAARAGEAGRGFSVVADEVRKLASSSKENVGQVNQITTNIQEMVNNLHMSFDEVNQISDTQAAAIQEISATLEEISHNAEKLSEMAKTRLE